MTRTVRRVAEWLTTQPIAHRGLHNKSAGVIENTLSAFEAAAQNHYAIELDVLPSKDGEAIVFHDDNLARLCGRPDRISDLPVAELAQIPLHGTRDFIPTLGDVLTHIHGRVPLLIELKADVREIGPLEARAAELLKAYDGPVAVQSFSPRSMAWFAAHVPQFTRGQLSMNYTAREARLPTLQRFALTNLLYNTLSKPDFIAYEVSSIAHTAPRLARRLGLPLITWTVRSRNDWQRAKRYADNLIFEGFAA